MNNVKGTQSFFDLEPPIDYHPLSRMSGPFLGCHSSPNGAQLRHISQTECGYSLETTTPPLAPHTHTHTHTHFWTIFYRLKREQRARIINRQQTHTHTDRYRVAIQISDKLY